jgi:hypothetical protein
MYADVVTVPTFDLLGNEKVLLNTSHTDVAKLESRHVADRDNT